MRHREARANETAPAGNAQRSAAVTGREDGDRDICGRGSLDLHHKAFSVTNRWGVEYAWVCPRNGVAGLLFRFLERCLLLISQSFSNYALAVSLVGGSGALAGFSGCTSAVARLGKIGVWRWRGCGPHWLVHRDAVDSAIPLNRPSLRLTMRPDPLVENRHMQTQTVLPSDSCLPCRDLEHQLRGWVPFFDNSIVDHIPLRHADQSACLLHHRMLFVLFSMHRTNGLFTSVRSAR